MRQWLGVDPKILCRQHLIGEYREHFAFYGILIRKRKVDGYFKSNCLEPLSLQARFNSLKSEMESRDYHTKSLTFPSEMFDYLGPNKYIKIDQNKTFILLMSKCKECLARAISSSCLPDEIKDNTMIDYKTGPNLNIKKQLLMRGECLV